jgi:hypothetical protein
MAKFVVYEVWSRARVVESESFDTVYSEAEPDPQMYDRFGLSLGNWHAVLVHDDTPVTDFRDTEPVLPSTGK